MNEEERARVERIRAIHETVEKLPPRLEWLLDLVERQDAEIRRMRPALPVEWAWTPHNSHMTGKLE